MTEAVTAPRMSEQASSVDIEARTPERIRAHYEIERALAAQLRDAPRASRQRLYTSLYDQLFCSVPDHPQHQRKRDENLLRQEVRRKMALVGRFLSPSARFLEIGAGDCAFTFEAAKRVQEATAVEVSAGLVGAERPANFRLVISDGCSVPVPPASVTVAYSNQLMEHLHPDDAEEQLRNICSALAPNGVYICITPNRVAGPHDISQHFDRIATGFHLREYTYRDLVDLFRSVGFTRFRGYFGGQGIYVRLPMAVFLLSEAILGCLPWSARKRASRSKIGRALLGANLVAFKG